jgi:Rrf2 family iron-sulfur cluster assembly transcriptional regulator
VKISSKTQYAVLAMMHLATRHGDGKPVPTGEIAEAQKIPFKFLTHVMLNLQEYGLVKALRGKRGGYMLGREPSLISMGDVVRAVEGSVVRCDVDIETPAYAAVEALWGDLTKNIEGRLNSTDIKTMIARAQGRA